MTHADDSRGSKAFIRVCLSRCDFLCVCVSVRTMEPKRLKLQSPNLLHHESAVYPIHLILGQKVEGQGHKLQKKNILKTIEWPTRVCTLSSDQPLVSKYFCSLFTLCALLLESTLQTIYRDDNTRANCDTNCIYSYRQLAQ